MWAMTDEQAHSGFRQRRWCLMMKYSSLSKYSSTLLIRNISTFSWWTVGYGSSRMRRMRNWAIQSIRQTKAAIPTSYSSSD